MTFNEYYLAARKHLNENLPQFDIHDPRWSERTISRVEFMNGVRFAFRLKNKKKQEPR